MCARSGSIQAAWFWRPASQAVSAGKRGDRWSRLRPVRGGAAEGGTGRYKGERVKYRMGRYSGSYDISPKYRYRTFTSIAILRYIEYRTSTSPNAVSILGFENCQSFFSHKCPCTYGVPQCAAHRNARRAPVWLSQHFPNSQNSCGTSHTDNCLINTPYCHACF